MPKGEHWVTHGKSKVSHAYRRWKAMRQRCNDHSAHNYKHYGGRGIGYCERWESFEKFMADMGEPPAGHSIGRIDNSKGYSKENCRWEDQRTQSRNHRRNRLYEIDGITKCLQDWCDQYGIGRSAVCHRIKAGWGPVEAITTPVHR